MTTSKWQTSWGMSAPLFWYGHIYLSTYLISIRIKVTRVTRLSGIDLAFNEPRYCFRPSAEKHCPRTPRVTNLGGILWTSNAAIRLYIYVFTFTGCGAYVCSNVGMVVLFCLWPASATQPATDTLFIMLVRVFVISFIGVATARTLRPLVAVLCRTAFTSRLG